MRFSSKGVAFSAVAAAVGVVSGCQNPGSSNQASAPLAAPSQTQSTAIRSDVTDIRPMEASAAPTSSAQTAAYQVAAADAAAQPITYTTVTPSAATFASAGALPTITPPAAAPATAGGNTHTVRRGETLYSIARESYGSGKEWKKIAMANPGVTPSTLKVGQNLVIP